MPGLMQPPRQINIDPTTGLVQVYAVKSLFTGNWNSLPLPPITQHDWNLWQSGAHIQTVLAHLSPDEREFLLTGATPEEWDAAFPEDDNDE